MEKIKVLFLLAVIILTIVGLYKIASFDFCPLYYGITCLPGK